MVCWDVVGRTAIAAKWCAASFAEYRMAIWGGWWSFELRHAELVSASIQRPNALFNLEKWILKQVQDDIAPNSKIWSSAAYALSTVCRWSAS
jgi:hypothetical protein